jgi:hypothetical protein
MSEQIDMFLPGQGEGYIKRTVRDPKRGIVHCLQYYVWVQWAQTKINCCFEFVQMLEFDVFFGSLSVFTETAAEVFGRARIRRTLLHWLRICDCRLPAGVINVLPGGSEVGQLLVTHSQVSKVMFSGLTGVGRLLRKQTAGLGMHLTLRKLSRSKDTYFLMSVNF